MQFLSLFQDKSGNRPSGGNDVYPVPAVAPQRRGPAPPMGHRYQLRDGTVLVEQVRDDNRGGTARDFRFRRCRLLKLIGYGVEKVGRQSSAPPLTIEIIE